MHLRLFLVWRTRLDALVAPEDGARPLRRWRREERIEVSVGALSLMLRRGPGSLAS